MRRCSWRALTPSSTATAPTLARGRPSATTAAQTSGSGSPTPRSCDRPQKQRVRVLSARQLLEQRRGYVPSQDVGGIRRTSQSSDAGSPRTAPAVAGRSRNPTSREPGASVTNRAVVSGPAIASRSPAQIRSTHASGTTRCSAPSPWPAPTCRPPPARRPDARRNPQSQSYPTGRDRWATVLV